MKTVKIIDMTLVEAKAINDSELTFKEKLEVAKGLDRLKVDAIELPPISDAKAEELTNKTIASMVGTVLSAQVDAATGDVEKTWESIKDAKQPRLSVVGAVSPVQMEYSNKMKGPDMLRAIEEQIKKSRYFCEHVEFIAMDATRAEEDFLISAIAKAIEAGANKITLCDTAGVMLPGEFGKFVANIKEKTPGMNEDIKLFVQISDEMDMAVACGAAAIENGASGIKCTAVKAGYPAIEKVAKFIQMKSGDMDIATNLRVTELHHIVEQLDDMFKSKADDDSIIGNIAVGERANVTLDSSDDIGKVISVIKQLGYELSEDDNAKVYEEFQRVAAEKNFVGTRELDAIVASAAHQVPSTYHIDSYVINSGNVIMATANVQLEKDGEKLRGVGVGDGPIDAAFLAIEQILGHHYEMDDFQIQTVTEGHDAMGSALVKLRSGGKVYSGTGISTDIIGASLRAYISALNKIVYAEQ